MQYALSQYGQKERDQTIRETTLRENLERCEEIISRYETQLKNYTDQQQQERRMCAGSSPLDSLTHVKFVVFQREAL